MGGFFCSLADVLDQILCLITGLVATGRALRDLQAFGANVLRRRPSADASPFISPRRPAGRAGRRIAGLRKSLAAPVIQQSQQRRAEPPKAFPPHGNSGRSRNVWTSGGISFAEIGSA